MESWAKDKTECFTYLSRAGAGEKCQDKPATCKPHSWFRRAAVTKTFARRVKVNMQA